MAKKQGDAEEIEGTEDTGTEEQAGSSGGDDDLVAELRKVRAGELDVDLKKDDPEKDKPAEGEEDTDADGDEDDADADEKTEEQEEEEAADEDADADKAKAKAEKDKAAADKKDDNKGEKKPEVAKALAAIARQERAAKQAVAAERQKLADERTAFAADKQKHDAEIGDFRRARERVKGDPIGAIKAAALALGFAEAELPNVARALWAGSSNDPALKAHAEEALRAHEYRSELDRLRAKVEETDAELKKRDDEKKKQDEAAAKAGARQKDVDHLGGLLKAGHIVETDGDGKETKTPIKAKFPLLAHYSATQKTAAEDMYEVARAWYRLNEGEGRGPTFGELCAAAEEFLTDHYDADYQAFIRSKAKETTQKKAGEEKTAKTLKNHHAARTSPQHEAKTQEEVDQEIAADLRAGRHLG